MELRANWQGLLLSAVLAFPWRPWQTCAQSSKALLWEVRLCECTRLSRGRVLRGLPGSSETFASAPVIATSATQRKPIDTTGQLSGKFEVCETRTPLHVHLST